MTFDLQLITDNNGYGIAITGMVIVFVALTMVSGFVALLPKILAVVEVVLPPSEAHHPPTPSSLDVDEGTVVAIAVALQAQRGYRDGPS